MIQNGPLLWFCTSLPGGTKDMGVTLPLLRGGGGGDYVNGTIYYSLASALGFFPNIFGCLCQYGLFMFIFKIPVP